MLYTSLRIYEKHFDQLFVRAGGQANVDVAICTRWSEINVMHVFVCIVLYQDEYCKKDSMLNYRYGFFYVKLNFTGLNKFGVIQ